MKWWILVVLVALLILSMMSRERFEPTEKIKAPPYDDAEKERIFRMASFDLQDRLRAQAAEVEGVPGGPEGEAVSNMARESASTMVARFYEFVYKTATSPITVRQIDSFVTQNSHPRDDVELRPGMRKLLKAYFIDQASARSSAAGPTGAAPPSTASSGTGGTGPSGTGASTSPGPAPGPSPAAEPSQKSKIYGPRFTGLGTPDPNGGGNGNGGAAQYPEIWGGRDANGMGGVGGQGTGGSSIVMPPLSSLGLDSNAMYFPYSRSPGDMDLIPDPYRVAQTWLPSRYSYNKTEPAPFLTDFSAFLR